MSVEIPATELPISREDLHDVAQKLRAMTRDWYAARNSGQQVVRGNDAWPIDGPLVNSDGFPITYSWELGKLPSQITVDIIRKFGRISVTSLMRWWQEKTQAKQVRILDIMGGGYVIDPAKLRENEEVEVAAVRLLNVDGHFASMKHKHDDQMKAALVKRMQLCQDRTVIEGDAWASATRRELSKVQPLSDIILFFPIAGLMNVPVVCKEIRPDNAAGLFEELMGLFLDRIAVRMSEDAILIAEIDVNYTEFLRQPSFEKMAERIRARLPNHIVLYRYSGNLLVVMPRKIMPELKSPDYLQVK